MDLSDTLVALKSLYGATGGMPGSAGAFMPTHQFGMTYNEATDFQITKVDLGSDLFKHFPPYEGTDVKITDYKFPKTSPRVRRPAHVVANDSEYMEKYKTAVQKMKYLPGDDPFNFYQQAKIHLDSPNDAFHQMDKSWIFLSGQRYYLYFYELVLGKLVGDETFALPYWNFDHVDGMALPSIFVNEAFPLDNAGGEMGNFFSSGRDEMFNGLHANVDRMWDVWRKKYHTTPHIDFRDPDWMDVVFYFYDVDGQVVRVKVIKLQVNSQ